MYNKLKDVMPGYEYICEEYKALCDLLVYKYELGIKTREAYRLGKDALALVIKDYNMSIRYLKKFIEAFRKVWYKENKPHGFDVQEIRLGGVLLRLESCKKRIIEYINGDVDCILELEEDILDLDGVSGKNHRKITEGINGYIFNVSANII